MRFVFLSIAILFWKTGTPKSQISHHKVCEWSGPCTGTYVYTKNWMIWNSCTGCIVNLDSEKLNVKTHFNKMYIECCLLRKFTIYIKQYFWWLKNSHCLKMLVYIFDKRNIIKGNTWYIFFLLVDIWIKIDYIFFMITVKILWSIFLVLDVTLHICVIPHLITCNPHK